MYNASAPSGPVLVMLLMNEDGTVYKSFKEDIGPRPWITTSLRAFEAMGVDFDHRGPGVKLRMPGWPGARNHVDVRAWYLEASADATRDVATVHAKVKALSE